MVFEVDVAVRPGRWGLMADPAPQEGQFLDRALTAIQGSAVWEGMNVLVDGLQEARDADGVASWHRFVREVALPHPICSVLQEDPFTSRAFAQPRGYPADPVTLDYIYGIVAGLRTPLDERAAELHAYTTSGAFARAVRHRRKVYAEAIDALPDGRPHEILAIGAGHLRELELSRAYRADTLGNVLALDGDPETVFAVARDHGTRGVRAAHTSLRQLLNGKVRPTPVHLAYTGLWFDHLASGPARALVAFVFSLLRPGGELLLSSFSPRLPDAAYLESFMRWPLVFRTEQETADLLELVDGAQIASLDVSRDPTGNVHFLRARRR